MFTRRNILILILQFTTTQMYIHQKPLTEKVWSERCQKNSIVLNDCNWCRCSSQQRYDCKARICEEVDMFGHFKDAIQEIDVGMEGHGSWRSKPLACTPGIHYRRGAILCVCDEDGNWPNPVCRDLFRILHSVEITGQTRLSKNDSCSPTKLYLVGCNVCFCPSLGYLDPQMCTNKECEEDDPVIEANQTPLINIPSKSVNDADEVLEIYAMCDPKYKYELGCRNCDCLRNNRLLCGNCSVSTDQYSKPLRSGKKSKSSHKIRWGKPRLVLDQPMLEHEESNDINSICKGKEIFKAFRIDCNLCHCDEKLKIYCTVKKCINKIFESPADFDMIEWRLSNFKNVSEPPDDESCVPGTKFKRDCNICQCSRIGNGIKQITCTRKICKSWGAIKNWKHWKVIEGQKKDCVPGTFYQENCMLCHCIIKDKLKYQICRLSEKCVGSIGLYQQFPRMDGTVGLYQVTNVKTQQGTTFQNVKSLYGFCEPMRRYKKDCNTCRCLSDGKTVECTSKICSLRSNDLSVEIVPVVIKNDEDCPKGHSYKLDCNLCFCLSNGNAICTTADCSKQYKVTI